ncbi:MAG: DUF721 domain-containing protein [Spirochaetaceae bacterium]|nr:DUF721 domain-containing protein [Spirochaetaceae bacterium]
MRKVDDLLQQFLDRIGRSDGAPYVGLFRGWRQIVGDRIADHAEPVDIRGSALIVEADHPGWVQMVMMSQTRILQEVKTRYPELTITGLHIRVVGDRAAAQSDAARRAGADGCEDLDQGPPPPPSPPSADAKQALERIDDSDLRGTLERLRQTLDEDKESEEGDV